MKNMWGIDEPRDLKKDLQDVYKDINNAQLGEQKYVKIEVACEWLERAIKAENELK
jgi:hypothetical protein